MNEEEVRDQICRMRLHPTEVLNYRLQGRMMKAAGIDLYYAHYPHDTWVGEARKTGWNDVEVTPKYS